MSDVEPWHSIVEVPVGLLEDLPALEAYLDGRTIEHMELMSYVPDWSKAGGAFVSTATARLVLGDDATPPATVAALLLAHPTDHRGPEAPARHPRHRGGTPKEDTHD